MEKIEDAAEKNMKNEYKEYSPSTIKNEFLSRNGDTKMINRSLQIIKNLQSKMRKI